MNYINHVILTGKGPKAVQRCNIRKSFSAHFKTGYPFVYIQVNGKVAHTHTDNQSFKQAFEGSFRHRDTSLNPLFSSKKFPIVKKRNDPVYFELKSETNQAK